MKKGILTITLKSDLCVASGYSYKGIVDTDVCYDEFGLPYIPARRLKGCFRDTAENLLYGIIDSEKISKLFGSRGSNMGGSLRLSNAKIEGYRKVRGELERLRYDDTLKDVFSQQRILNQYTHIVAQTKIGKDDTAEDNSLRYTRVINHYDADLKETAFEATIEFDENVIDEEDLKLIVSATKHIGLKRNRGLGNVQCYYKTSNNNEKYEDFDYSLNCDNENECVITYVLKNDEPLMLSQMCDTHSEKYISGQMILGQLAGRYLNKDGKAADSIEFEDLFLNGTTKFVPAYPALVVDSEVRIFYPAPLNINRRKKSKEYVNVVFPITDDPGNQPKKLKGKYVYLINNDENSDKNKGETLINVKEIDMKLHYHHRRDKFTSDGRIDEGILYPSEAIEPNQVFAGQIFTKKKYVATLIELMHNEDFYFGKSKNAQYGHCKCIVNDAKKESDENIISDVDTADRILVTLLTDSIFMSDSDYTVNQCSILKQLIEIIPGTSEVSSDECSVLQETGLVSGYQTSWNLHKPLYPVVKAGSCFILKYSGTGNLQKNVWLGTKNQEGYGLAKVEHLKNRVIKEVVNDEDSKLAGNKSVEGIFKTLYCNILKDIILESIISETQDMHFRDVSKTQISRAILMLKQSDDFVDFINRVSSIKSESVKNQFESELIKPFEKNGKLCVEQMISKSFRANTYYSSLDDSLKREMNDIWKEYLLYRLIICKYEAKEA